MTKPPSEHYDIVVLGGGLVGSSFSCALAALMQQTDLRVLVVEAVKFPLDLPEPGDGDRPAASVSSSFDARTTALSYGSVKIYERMGLWDDLAAQATPIKRIHVSDRGHFGTVAIDSADQPIDALGYVVENLHLGRTLTRALAQTEAIDFLCPASLKTIRPNPDGMELTLECPQSAGTNTNEQSACRTLTAALVVLADGGKSPARLQLGISSQIKNYQQKAIISNIAFSEAHANVAYERFTDSGPLAVLPLPKLDGNNRGALIWTVAEPDAEQLLALTDDEFLARLQLRFGFRLGQFTRAGARFAYPLSLTIAREQIRPGLVLLGNVAQTLHPVAGQGFNLALRNAQALAEVLSAGHARSESPGSMTVLQRYVDRQKKDQNTTAGFSDYMMRLFSNNSSALVWARKFGLFSIDVMPPLKANFARQAMGLADQAPRESPLPVRD